MEPKYRAALIGCGGISYRHAKAYLEQGNVDIVAACDINEENLNKVCDEFDISARYADHETLFNEQDIDLVSVCTYPKAHAEQTIASAKAGTKAVLCEKPMCLGLGEADDMIATCRENGTKLVIAHRHRQNPNFTKARELVADGAIGEPRLIWCYLTSAIIDNGTHIVDMMRYLLGDPEADWVMGHASRQRDTLYQSSPAEESSAGLIAFKTGTRALVEMGELTPDDGFNFRILGSEGSLEAAIKGVDWFDKHGANEFRAEPNQGFIEQTREMISWVEGGPEPRNPGEKGRAVTELLMAIHESARTGSLVRFPLEVRGYPMEDRLH
jgi:UDP-N-acetyl-2-amino-2-deoxyglucuronate dehydrogenase